MFEGCFGDPKNLNTAASLALIKNHQVIGFNIFQTRPYVGDEHLELICIHSDYQGKQLGQHLLTLSILKVIEQGKRLLSLGVDLDNSAAYWVYQKLGFEIQSKFITHVWQDNHKESV